MGECVCICDVWGDGGRLLFCHDHRASTPCRAHLRISSEVITFPRCLTGGMSGSSRDAGAQWQSHRYLGVQSSIFDFGCFKIVTPPPPLESDGEPTPAQRRVAFVKQARHNRLYPPTDRTGTAFPTSPPYQEGVANMHRHRRPHRWEAPPVVILPCSSPSRMRARQPYGES